jgi:DNA-directed RNA polymerase specialized sigma24 family protein
MITSPSGDPQVPVEGGAASGQMATNAEKIDTVRGAFLNLYDQEYLPVVRFVMRLGASLQDAEDAVQEAFTEAWASLTPQPEKWSEIHEPRGWIRTIAKRKYQRPPGSRRRPLPVPVRELDEVRESPSHAETRHDELTLETLYVLDAMRMLDPLPQAVLAFHMDGFSAPEIAIHLGLRDDQEARDLLKKARKTLARELARSRDQERRDS